MLLQKAVDNINFQSIKQICFPSLLNDVDRSRTGDYGPQGPPGDAGESISSTDGWKFKVKTFVFRLIL